MLEKSVANAGQERAHAAAIGSISRRGRFGYRRLFQEQSGQQRRPRALAVRRPDMHGMVELIMTKSDSPSEDGAADSSLRRRVCLLPDAQKQVAGPSSSVMRCSPRFALGRGVRTPLLRRVEPAGMSHASARIPEAIRHWIEDCGTIDVSRRPDFSRLVRLPAIFRRYRSPLTLRSAKTHRGQAGDIRRGASRA